MSEGSGSDRVIPFSVEIIPGDVDLFPILLGDLDSLRIGILIESALNRESLKRGAGGDQIDDHLVTDQGAPPPVHADEGKHPMFDLVPFTGLGRQMTHGDRQAGFVRKGLQLTFPETHAGPVAPSAVRRDQKGAGRRISLNSHLCPPPADAFHGKGGRVVIDSHTDPSFIAGKIVDAVG